MVIAIISILAALLLPALTAAKARARRIACFNNLKQMATATQMYALDDDGKLVGNIADGQNPNSWVLGNMKQIDQSTNTALLRAGKLFPYLGNPGVYQCPADPSTAFGYKRARGYSMNCWVGSRAMESLGGVNAYRTFVKDNELAAAGPATIWEIMDEHENSIDDGNFLVNMNDYLPFQSFPAVRHEHGYALNFGDGHVERFPLTDPNTMAPGSSGNYSNALPTNKDWIRLKQFTTVPLR